MPYKDPEKRKQYLKNYYQKNKEKFQEYNKKYKEENKEKITAQSKKYYQENQELILSKRKNYYQKNKEKQKGYMKKYREEKREQINKTAKKYRIEKYHTDPCYKLRKLASRMVNAALKEGKSGKSILPYVDWNSYEELKAHLESQFEDWMTWENHGMWHPTERRWQIDHIKPQSVLLEGVTSMDDPKFRECWALENLQPLEARENIIKGSKLLDE